MRKADTKISNALLICIFLAVFVLSCLTPMLADDYSYSFSYADRSRIGDLGGILASLQAHRQSINGRMVPHFFAHLFLMLPKLVFNIINAAVCTALFYVMSRYAPAVHGAGEKRGAALAVLCFLIFAVWIFTPVYGQVFLWLDGACNYSWAALFILIFLLPYFRLYMDNGHSAPPALWKKLLFCAAAFIAGAYSEGASFGMIFTAFCFAMLTWTDKRKVPAWLIAAFAAACLGYLWLMTAPSEWSGRTGEFSIVNAAKNLKRIISAPKESFLALFGIYFALFALCVSFKAPKKVLVSAAVLFAGAWATLVLFAFALYLPWRSLLHMVLLLCLGCTLMLAALWQTEKKYLVSALIAVLGAVFMFEFMLGAGDIANVWSQSRRREAEIYSALGAGVTEVGLEPYMADTKYSGAYLLADIYEDAGEWPNYDLAGYYGLDAVYAVLSQGEPVQ